MLLCSLFRNNKQSKEKKTKNRKIVNKSLLAYATRKGHASCQRRWFWFIGQIKIIFVSLTLFQIQLRSVEDDRDAVKDNARLSM